MKSLETFTAIAYRHRLSPSLITTAYCHRLPTIAYHHRLPLNDP